MIKSCIDEGKTTTFRVRGYSMRPFLENDRDCVVIGPVKPCEIKIGDVVLAEVSKQVYVLHRVVKKNDKLFVLRGDGNVYGTETCKHCDVIGIAKAFQIGNKEISTSSLKWRIYSFLWPRNSFLRRCFLFLFRHTISRIASNCQKYQPQREDTKGFRLQYPLLFSTLVCTFKE